MHRRADDPTDWVIQATLAAAAASALATALVWTLPFARFAYRGPALHVALETAAALTALLVAYLVFLRFRRRGSLSDLILFSALAVLATTNTFFSALPSALGEAPGTFSTWAPVGGRLLSAILLATAAFAPDTAVRRPGRAVAAIVGFGAALALIAVGVVLFGSRLPTAVDPELSPEASVDPVIAAHPTVLGVQIVLMLLVAAAAAGFMRAAQARDDELLAWFALATVLGTVAHVNYFLFPSLYSNWVYTGDGFRLAFHVALLLGAAREIRAYQRGLIDAAALRERRRVARDLHDGLAQELAFVATQSRCLASERPSRSGLVALQTAAERALDLSRDAIAALARPAGEEQPLDLVVRQAAHEVAERAGVAFAVVADPDVEAGREVRQALVPIVREAVTNAARPRARRHGDDRAQARRRPAASDHRRRHRVRPQSRARLRPDEHARARRGSGRRAHACVRRRPGHRDRGGAAIAERARVLVADDHPPTLLGVRFALERRGFVVCAECADAPSAVAAAERERPDVCLLDVKMPGDGVAAAYQIVSRVPGAAVVMLTVSHDDEDLFEALRAGASGYLLKDTHPDRLADALRDVLGGEAALSPVLVARVIEEFRGRRRRVPRHGRRGVGLTAREWEVLELLRQGLSTAAIAERLAISPVTVRRHVGRALEVLRVPDREAALRLLGDR